MKGMLSVDEVAADRDAIAAALGVAWVELHEAGQDRAAEWVVEISAARGEDPEGHNRMVDELLAIAAGGLHVTAISFDEIAEQIGEAGPWWVLCYTCDERIDGHDPTSSIGYYRTERAAMAAAAEHQLAAGPRITRV